VIDLKWEKKKINPMPPPTMEDIESDFVQLSPEAQLTLIERLVHRLRVHIATPPGSWDRNISAMAGDPQIQRELNRIDA
jgi:hypothetical protein